MVRLSGGTVQDFSPQFERSVGVHSGVHAHARSSAHLSRLSISGMRHGVCVRTHASATLCDCTVVTTVKSCGRFEEGATGRLNNCTLSSSKEEHVWAVKDAGSCVHAAVTATF